MVYIWFRFEWQFGVGAMISTLHDVVTTVGLFAMFQLEFNLTTLGGDPDRSPAIRSTTPS